MILRDIENRTELEEFEDLSMRIDGFRTHKYRQYSITAVPLSDGNVNKEIPLEATSITIKYPVDATIRINDLTAPEIDLKCVRFVEGTIYRIYVDSPGQTPDLVIYGGYGDFKIEPPALAFKGKRITGDTIAAWRCPLTWFSLPLQKRKVTIHNLSATDTMKVRAYGYIELSTLNILVPEKEIPIGGGCDMNLSGMYDYVSVHVKNVSGDCPYRIDYLGLNIEDGERAFNGATVCGTSDFVISNELQVDVVDMGVDGDTIIAALAAIEAQTAVGDLISERINSVGINALHFIPKTVQRYISLVVEDMGSNTEIYIGSEGVGKLCTKKGDGICQLPVSNAAQVYVWGNSPRHDGSVSYIGV